MGSEQPEVGEDSPHSHAALLGPEKRSGTLGPIHYKELRGEPGFCSWTWLYTSDSVYLRCDLHLHLISNNNRLTGLLYGSNEIIYEMCLAQCWHDLCFLHLL